MKISKDSMGGTTIISGDDGTYQMHVYADAPGTGYISRSEGDDFISYYVFNTGIVGGNDDTRNIWNNRTGFTYAPFHVSNETIGQNNNIIS